MAAAATRVLGEFVAGLTAAALPDEVVERAKAHLLYNLACGMAADQQVLDPVPALARAGGAPEAGVVGLDMRLPVETAAFVNGAILHSRAQDDTHFPSQTHPGAAVIPAALALAEREDRVGAELLAAVVAGYEVTAAFGEPLAEGIVARGFRAASLFGTLGAAAAAASILRLDAARAADAIAIAASFTGGLTETWLAGSGEWPWQLGAAARSGITAATLAAAGVTGAVTALDGPSGFASAFAGGGPFGDWQLGERWRTLEVIYKPYPVCNITQAPVALAARLRDRIDGEPPTAIRCSLNPADRAYPGTVNRGPFTATSATLMSAPFCVALGLHHGGVTLDGLRAFEDPALLALTDRIEILADDRLPPLAARLEVDAGGSTLADAIVDDGLFRSGWDEAVAACGRLTSGNRLLAAASRLPGLPRAAELAAATQP